MKEKTISGISLKESKTTNQKNVLTLPFTLNNQCKKFNSPKK